MVKGTIVDTTPSDEILKKNKEVESVCSSCVKNAKVKTFEYISSKYERNDKFGFKSQELQQELPEEFKNIVNERKEKHCEERYLSINYMTRLVVLWKTVQEQMNRIDK